MTEGKYYNEEKEKLLEQERLWVSRQTKEVDRLLLDQLPEIFADKKSIRTLYAKFLVGSWRAVNPALERQQIQFLLLDSAKVDLLTLGDQTEVDYKETIIGIPELPGEEPPFSDPWARYLYFTCNHRILSSDEATFLSRLTKLAKLAGQLESQGFSTQALRQAAVDGKAAKSDLGIYNQKLVVSKSLEMVNIPFDADIAQGLAQSGNVGLQKAIDKFDPERGIQFSTYATWWINNYVKQQNKFNSYEVYVPIHVYDAIGKVLKAKQKLTKEKTKPDAENIAKVTGLTKEMVEDVIDHLAYRTDMKSLQDLDDSDLPSDPATLGNPEAVLIEKQRQEGLKNLVDILPERRAGVIKKRFPLDGDEPMTLEEVGTDMGVVRERVRQIEVDALNRLRSPTLRRKLDDL